MNDNIQKQIISLVQAAMQGNEEATKQIQSIMEAAKSGNKEAVALANVIQQVISKLTPKAKFGTKLNYLRKLKGTCAPDEELVYFKKGGRMKCGCRKKAQLKAGTTKKNV